MAIAHPTETLAAEELNPEAYRPYGDVVCSREDIRPASANMGTAERFNRIGPLENLRPADATANLCVFRSQPYQGAEFVIRMLERHAFSTQLFVPMDCERRYLVVVCLGKDEPDLGTLRAFLARPDQGITYRPGVWHHPLIALDEVTQFACVVFENGKPDDCQTHGLARPIRVPLGP